MISHMSHRCGIFNATKLNFIMAMITALGLYFPLKQKLQVNFNINNLKHF